MGRMLEALRRIEAKGGSLVAVDTEAVTARASVPTLSPPAADESAAETHLAIESLLDKASQETGRLLDTPLVEAEGDNCLTASRRAAPVEPAPAESSAAAQLAAHLASAHAAEGPVALMVATVGAETTIAALLETLAEELSRQCGGETPLIEARRTYAARLAELRDRYRVVLFTGAVESDNTMALCRHCDAIYLAVPLGRVTERQVSRAAARIRSFDGRLVGAVALG